MIRKLKLKDINDVIKIEKDLFNESLGQDLIFKSIFKQCKASYYVLTKNFKVIGFIGIMDVFPDCEIFELGIEKKEQKKGYGTKIMKYIIRILKKKNFENIYLDVRTRNFPAIKLYEKLGFKRYNKRPNFYNNDDSFGYVKELKKW